MADAEKRWALVTGASSGLGIEFAIALAARGYDLVLTARREAPMQALAATLRQRHAIRVVVEPLDLAAPDSAAVLLARLDAQQIDPAVLVNNAAFGISGPLIEQDPARLRQMLQLDLVTLTELTHAFAQRMTARGRGHVLLVASMAAFQPTPLLAAYGAAKAYVLSLGVSLNIELAPKVGVTVLSPGLMETEFFDVSGYRPPAPLRRTMIPAARVATIGLDALFAGKSDVVAGRLNKLMTLGGSLFTRHRQARMAYNMSKTPG